MCLALAAGLAACQTANAQRPPISLEVRGGVAVPVGEWKEPNLGDVTAGPSVDLRGLWSVHHRVDVYLTYSRQKWTAEPTATSGEGTVVDQGAGVGFRAYLAPDSRVRPFLGAGVVVHTVGGSGFSDYYYNDEAKRPEAGFLAETGIDLPLASRLSLTPAVSYVSYRTFIHPDAREDWLEYLRLSLGAKVRL